MAVALLRISVFEHVLFVKRLCCGLFRPMICLFVIALALPGRSDLCLSLFSSTYDSATFPLSSLSFIIFFFVSIPSSSAESLVSVRFFSGFGPQDVCNLLTFRLEVL